MEARFVRVMRALAGMSQTDLAKALKISQAQVSRLENGQRRITERQQRALRQIFGRAEDDLGETRDTGALE